MKKNVIDDLRGTIVGDFDGLSMPPPNANLSAEVCKVMVQVN
jgi:hypothetical protein